MSLRNIAVFIKSRYIDPKYAFQDRLYFLFGTAGLSVAALILDGLCRIAVLGLALVFDIINLHLGFKFPELAYPLCYEER